MVVVGLTGGIASGKSMVSDMLSALGALIIDTDKLSREVTLPGKPAWQEIVDRFGKEILDADSQINRKCLGQIVFADSQARAVLERITHPRIEAEVMAVINNAKWRGCASVVLDAPLLIEAGWQNKVDVVWVVFVDEQTQLDRLMLRDNISYEDAMARINAQLSLAEKLKYADVVIDNSASQEQTRKQVIRAWNTLSAVTSQYK